MDNSAKRGNQNPSELGKKKMAQIKLADGETYDLSPINLNILCEIEDKFGKSVDEIFTKPSMKTIRFVIFLKLRKSYPDMTEEKVGDLINEDVMANIGELLGA